MVALRKESVDRNGLGFGHFRDDVPSLSARRAWIEIITVIRTPIGCVVALRKESVDRNPVSAPSGAPTTVALRKESVDRNGGLMSVVRFATCRSPQGERG